MAAARRMREACNVRADLQILPIEVARFSLDSAIPAPTPIGPRAKINFKIVLRNCFSQRILLHAALSYKPCSNHIWLGLILKPAPCTYKRNYDNF